MTPETRPRLLDLFCGGDKRCNTYQPAPWAATSRRQTAMQPSIQERQHLQVGKFVALFPTCPLHHRDVVLLVTATGRGIGITQGICLGRDAVGWEPCPWRPATAMRYYLYGDDTVGVEPLSPEPR